MNDDDETAGHRAPLISARGVSKAFSGVYALSSVDFELRRGEVHALLGPNGAGKSTLIKILNGVQEADSGVIEIEGRERTSSDIATVFQELSLVPHLTVAQNIFLGHELRTPLGLLRNREMRATAARVTRSLGLSLHADALIGDLSGAQRQLVEIAKAVHRQARVLVLDEPTSTLTRSDQVLLFESIRDIKKSGVGIIYVTHRLGEVFELADRVTVIRDGRRVLTAPVGEISMPRLVQEITGTGAEAAAGVPPKEAFDRFLEPGDSTAEAGVPRLRVEHLSGDRFTDVSFELEPGQIVGIAGLIGSGRTELLETIAGLRARHHGEVQVNGKSVAFREPWQALAAGIALVPEDRHKSGVMLQHSIQRNLTVAHQKRLRRMRWFVDGRRSRTLTTDLITTLHIKAQSPASPVAALSGGNQQKVVFAKWLQPDLQVLLLDEPTQGVDVGARQEIYRVIRRFAEEGASVFVVSSDFVELRELCEQIHYMTSDGLSEPFAVTEAVSDQSIYLELNERVHRGNAPARN